MEKKIVKVHYDKNGWVCKRYPYDIPIEDEERYIEVEEEAYNQTLNTPFCYAWRVVEGELVNELCEYATAEDLAELDAAQKTDEASLLRIELTAISEDIVQDMAGEEVPDIEARKARFIEIHNRIRELQGKPTRKIK